MSALRKNAIRAAARYRAADHHYSRVLESAFGADACNRRYDPPQIKAVTHPLACLVAHDVLDAARARWESVAVHRNRNHRSTRRPPLAWR